MHILSKPYIILLISLATHTTTSGFVDKIPEVGNFIADVFIQPGYKEQQRHLQVIFEDYFKYDFIQADTFKAKLKNIIIIGDKIIAHGFEDLHLSDDEEVRQQIADRLLKVLLLHKRTIYAKLNNLKAQPDGSTIEFSNALKTHFTKVLGYYVSRCMVFQFTAEDPSSELDFKPSTTMKESYEEKAKAELDLLNNQSIIDDALLAFFGPESTETGIFRVNTRDFILKHKHTYFNTGIDLTEQFINFRRNYRSQLLEVLRIIFDGIQQGVYLIDEETVEIVSDILHSVNDINDSLAIDDPQGLIHQFAMQILLPHRFLIPEPWFKRFLDIVFECLLQHKNDSKMASLRDILIGYILAPTYEHLDTVSRKNALEVKYKTDKVITNYDPEVYEYSKEIVQIYMFDLVYISELADMRLMPNDLDTIIRKREILEKFPLISLLIMNRVDRFFNIKTSNKLMLPLLKSLYNFFLAMSAKLPHLLDFNQSKASEQAEYHDIDDKTLAHFMDSYLDEVFKANLKIPNFDFDIENNYIVFKLLNYYNNMDYFKDHDINFLNAVPKKSLDRSLIREIFPKFDDLIGLVMASNMKKTTNMKNEKYFSGKTIRKEITETFHLSALKGVQTISTSMILI